MTLLERINEFLKDNPQGTSFESEAVEIIEQCRDKMKWYQEKYHDLLLCVENKIPGETRHETAKRIINQRENQDHGPEKAA